MDTQTGGQDDSSMCPKHVVKIIRMCEVQHNIFPVITHVRIHLHHLHMTFSFSKLIHKTQIFKHVTKCQ